MDFHNILIAHNDSIFTITINRPEKLNALNRATVTELHHAFDLAANDPNVRVVVITGAGPKAFIAGADISELANLSSVESLAFSRFGQQLMSKIERLGKPVIAAINGFALGGGMELAMACSLRIASNTAKFGQPEINLGVIPGFGGTQRLLRLAGRNAALELCLLGTTINAERALSLNIISRSVEAEKLSESVELIAKQLAASAPHAVRGILDAILIGGEASIEVGLDYESQAFAVCAATADKAEGTQAFLQKRPALFTGR